MDKLVDKGILPTDSGQLEVMDESLIELLSIFEPEKTEDLIHIQSQNNNGLNREDALFSACSKVAQVLGISLVKPNFFLKETDKPERFLEKIAEASQCRIRLMTLTDYWWQKDAGPLIGFRKPNDVPGAFIRKREKYFFIDAIHQTQTLVTLDLANTFSTTVYRFYKTLPDTPLNWHHLLQFSFWNLKKDFQKIIVLQLFSSLLALLLPIITGMIFETIIPNADVGNLRQIMYLLMITTIVSSGFGLAEALYLIRVRFNANIAIAAAIWDRILRLPLSFFRQFSAGDLANRASGIDTLQQFINSSMLTTIISGTFSILSLFLMFYYDVWLALAATGLAIIAVIISLVFNVTQLKYQRPLLALEGKISGILFQLLTNLHKIRIANHENEAFALWSKTFSQKNKLFLKTQINIIAYGVFYPLFIVFSTAILYTLVVARGKDLSFGDFIAFSVAFGQFFSALLSMAAVVNRAMMIVPLYERVKPILQTIPEIENYGIDPGSLKGKISIQNVNFKYAEDLPLILENISIEVPAGSFIALIGPTGSGKSTLFRLLLGFEESKKNTLFYDGHDISTLNKKALRKQIGVVSHMSMIIPGSIYENITSLAPNLTLEDAEHAAQQMGILEEISAMPMGMHTWVSEGAKNISVGQRQRIILARAIIHKPKILLLDEATSALDNITQALILTHLAQLKMTRIVIAHRLSTVKNADCIYVLEKGKIVETGTYTHLMKKPGLFEKLVKRQIL
ncbi:MAG TPA: NHLP bacteriocin export ABC transporter permease/ATPase subunit [Gammaproteobacteria bacterium]|nr:NHLP bacteriocin export ABC transporter permease/ATPase subunit [Gammaproteobacteria bacterium]